MRGDPELMEFVKTIEEHQEILEKMDNSDFRKLLNISGQIFDQLKSNNIRVPNIAILLLEIHKQNQKHIVEYDYAFG